MDSFFSQLVGELLGTFLLILLGNGVVANVVLAQTKGNSSGWIVITFGWGLAVFVGVFSSMQFGPSHLNPAVTLGFAVAGAFPWGQVPGFVLAQMLGAMLGATAVWQMYRQHYAVTEDADTKLATFATIPAIRGTGANLFSEVLGTFVLVFAVLHILGPELTAPELTDVSFGLGAIGALPVGLLVFAIGMSLGGTTGYAINPARDLGPRIMHALLPIHAKGGSNWDYAWIPILGPLAGGGLAALLYLLLQPLLVQA